MSRQSTIRNIRLILIIAAVVLLTVPLATAFASVDEAQESVRARATWNLRMRSGPGTDYDKIGVVAKDATVPVLGRNEAATWVLIEDNGTQGWVASAYCVFTGDLLSVPVNTNYTPPPVAESAVPAEQPAAAAPAAAPETEAAPAGDTVSNVVAKPIYDMNLRTGPGTNYGRTSVVPVGSVTYVLYQYTVDDKVWLNVDYDGERGWLASWYVTLTGNLADVPQADLNTTITAPPVVAAPSPTPVPPPVVSAPGAYSAPLSRMGDNVRSIFERGQQNGKRANAFTVVGDCETASPEFLRPFDRGEYEMYQYEYLEVAINWFSGSFSHTGQAAREGFPVEAILDPIWANPNLCLPGESPLACEYRTWQPAFALIMVRTPEYDNGPGSDYYYNLKEVIEFSVSQGVVPILSTLPFQAGAHPLVDSMNDSIRLLAQEHNVPLWDFHLTTESLDSRGVDMTYHLTMPDRELPTHFTDTSLRAGMTRRNLEALEVLHAAMSNSIW